MARSTHQEEEQLQDAYWVDQALKGDPQAFRYLFERYREKAYRMAYRFLSHNEEAVEATQEAFIKAFRALENFEGRSKFSTWLMRIVTNTCLDRRRARVEPTVPLSDEMQEVLGRSQQVGVQPGGGPVEQLEYGELHAALADALAQLSEEHRAVFVLHTEEGMKYREIAQELQISEGTVMSRLYHARKNLQKMLGRAGVLDENARSREADHET